MNTSKLLRSGLQFIAMSLLGLSPELLAAGPSQTDNELDGAMLYEDFACIACHGPAGAKPLPGMPRLDGQDATYLLYQLRDFKSGERLNSRSATMVGYMETILDEEMQAIAQWLSEQR